MNRRRRNCFGALNLRWSTSLRHGRFKTIGSAINRYERCFSSRCMLELPLS
ncbi:hypothetical protein D0U02_29685 [Burkholderia pseudomallei]|nr:hypothetical protein EGY15_31125 [Burkholderia pseudomallei]PNW95033.1 hypothetical protein CF649_32015 [Burkholderia sp. 136(2017)]PNX11111.1 hypothetical protein CF650_31850 [Burkholderia sp. 129]PNX24075.1 hypothetical protein CF647_34445 [Burkholderia sp. 117]PNX32063.1 hypothetical protein CF648_32020 [Burkholderia sp. 137]